MDGEEHFDAHPNDLLMVRGRDAEVAPGEVAEARALASHWARSLPDEYVGPVDVAVGQTMLACVDPSVGVRLYCLVGYDADGGVVVLDNGMGVRCMVSVDALRRRNAVVVVGDVVARVDQVRFVAPSEREV